MRRILTTLSSVLLALAGCTAVDNEPLTPPPSYTAAPNGSTVSQIYGFCRKFADRRCPSDSVYCTAYKRSFVKGCLLRYDVPASYIIVLLN